MPRAANPDPFGTTKSYNADGQLRQEATPQGTLSYSYDESGQVASMTLPGSGTVNYSYNPAGQLESLTDPLGQAYAFGYDEAGNQNAISFPSGIKETRTYTPAKRIAKIQYSNGQSPLASFAYTYNQAGDRSGESSPQGNWSYAYDSLGRLIGANGPAGAFSYSYDPAGQITQAKSPSASKSYSYDSAGRLASDGTSTYSYNAAGDRIAAGESALTYNALGQMTASSMGGATTTYAYNPAGLRVSQSSQGASTQTLWNTLDEVPLPVTDGPASLIYDGQTPLAQLEGQSESQLLTDALGSVRDQANSSAAITASESFQPFGEPEAKTGAPSALGYTGALAGPEGMVYDQARYYDPATAQFMTPDSVIPNGPGTQGYGLYGYAANDPATLADPSGPPLLSWTHPL